MTSNFLNDKHNGEINYFYENGKPLLKGTLKNSEADGIWEFYDEKGNLKYKGEYKEIKPKFISEFEKNRQKILKKN
jgi:hypothetical protein